MQTSATGKPLRNKRPVVSVLQRGFSLIELLVVMFMIALLSGVAIVAIGGRSQSDESLQLAAAQLLDLMNLASMQSVIVSRPVGMHWLAPESEEDGWQVRWSQWQLGQWRELTEGPAPFELPVHIQVALEAEGSLVDLSNAGVDDQADMLPVPGLVFYATGEVTPFALELSAASEQQVSGTRVQVSNLRTGEIVLER